MIDTTTLSRAMREIAAERGDFWLFGLFMRTETPGRWDLVISAPWLEAGKLKALSEFVQSLSDKIGDDAFREFARIATLPSDSAFLGFIATSMPNVDRELRVSSSDLRTRGIEEAIILRTTGVDVSEPHVDVSRFDRVWSRIVKNAGRDFRTVKGLSFTYSASGNVVIPSRTHRRIPKSDFAKAFARLPLKNTAAIHDLQGPSYVYAILTDHRISAETS